ncbi:MAG TPA: NAD-dependent epimerase/dehydratase family protein [Spirochaetia bacterium]|nr:NAD-dependent epimerase/dehydratase family protein [Spirochaetia bacterium]
MIALTGATGHLGHVLVQQLLAAGERVRVVTRGSSDVTGLDLAKVERVIADLTDVDALRAAFTGASIVYNAAAKISFGMDTREELYRVNVEGTRCVVEAASAAKVDRLVHVSSIEAFPLTIGPYPITEALGIDPEHTVMEYGRTKALGTRIVLDAARAGLDAVVVCPTAFIGPPDFRLSPMGRLVFDFARGRLPAYVDGGFDFADVRDISRGVILAGTGGRSGELYLLSGRYASVPDLMELLSRLCGRRKPIFCLPIKVIASLLPPVELYYRITRRPPRFTRDSLHILSYGIRVDSSKAVRELGYSVRPLEVTLSDTLAWFSEQGMLR